MKRFDMATAFALTALPLFVGCAPQEPSSAPVPVAADQQLLARSNPAAGATVSAPVDELELWFDPPARLGEVVVSGPEGTMPMMVTAVGEVGYYSLPLSGLSAGQYTVRWKASRGGKDYQGSFSFSVR